VTEDEGPVPVEGFAAEELTDDHERHREAQIDGEQHDRDLAVLRRRLGLRSRYGVRIMKMITKLGKATPAMIGGNRSSSSWRPTKYQGALAGSG